MAQARSARIQDHFAELTDPRRRKVVYPLINVVTIALCAVLCGADDFVAIAEFGEKRRQWFAKFLDLRSGTPMRLLSSGAASDGVGPLISRFGAGERTRERRGTFFAAWS